MENKLTIKTNEPKSADKCYVCVARCPELEDTGDTRKCTLTEREYQENYLTRTTDWCPCGNNELFVPINQETIRESGEY